MSYHGDYVEDFADLNFKFTTHTAAGVPITLAGSPVVSVYTSADTGQSVAGVTLTVDFDAVTGLHNVNIDLSADVFYATGADYDVVITTGTVDGVSVVGYVVGSFSIENRIQNLQKYAGPRGPGVYLDDAAGNTSTEKGVDGTADNPVSTIAAATTVAGLLGTTRIYLVNDSVITLAQTYDGWEFVGIGGLGANMITLGSQDVDFTSFFNLIITGAQGGTGPMTVIEGALVSLTGCEAYVYRSAITGPITLRASADSYFDNCYSAVPGNATPELTFAASANLSWRHYSGGLQINSMAATNTMSYEADGQIVIDATCSGGALTCRGNMTLTDNAGGAVTVTDDARLDTDHIADQVWDEVLTGATHNIATSAGRRLRTLQDFGVYEGGAIWIDTVNGTAGTTDFENGTVNNPVDSLADALDLALSVGLDAFQILPGSSITLGPTSDVIDGFEFRGFSYTIALNGQSVSGVKFVGATISGNDDGSNGTPTVYVRCDMGSNTLGAHILLGCRLTGDIVLAEATDYFWDQCFSGVAGTGTPSVDFESAAETKNLSIRHYSGGMEFKNHGTGGGTHNTSLEGFGQVVLNANCAGGTIAIRGNFTVTDNAGDVVTLSDDARVEVTHRMAANIEAIAGSTDSAVNLDASAEVIETATVDTVTNSHTPTTTEFQCDDITDPNADHYNGRVVIFRTGNNVRVATDIVDYALVGGIGQFTVTAIPVAPSDDDTLVIV